MSGKGIEDLQLVPATQEHVVQVVTLWVAVSIEKSMRDKGWNYRIFRWDQIIPHSGFLSFAATDPRRRVEGLLAVSRHPDAIKIDFVSAAPWNHGSDRMRRGVGAGLVSNAIEMSVEAGLGGEVVLASTPESEPFYEHKLHFDRTGERDHEGLAVFRLRAAMSQAVIRAYPPIKKGG